MHERNANLSLDLLIGLHRPYISLGYELMSWCQIVNKGVGHTDIGEIEVSHRWCKYS